MSGFSDYNDYNASYSTTPVSGEVDEIKITRIKPSTRDYPTGTWLKTFTGESMKGVEESIQDSFGGGTYGSQRYSKGKVVGQMEKFVLPGAAKDREGNILREDGSVEHHDDGLGFSAGPGNHHNGSPISAISSQLQTASIRCASLEKEIIEVRRVSADALLEKDRLRNKLKILQQELDDSTERFKKKIYKLEQDHESQINLMKMRHQGELNQADLAKQRAVLNAQQEMLSKKGGSDNALVEKLLTAVLANTKSSAPGSIDEILETQEKLAKLQGKNDSSGNLAETVTQTLSGVGVAAQAFFNQRADAQRKENEAPHQSQASQQQASQPKSRALPGGDPSKAAPLPIEGEVPEGFWTTERFALHLKDGVSFGPDPRGWAREAIKEIGTEGRFALASLAEDDDVSPFLSRIYKLDLLGLQKEVQEDEGKQQWLFNVLSQLKELAKHG